MKYIKDGKVAVILNSDWGSGWSTSATTPLQAEKRLFNRVIAKEIEKTGNNTVYLPKHERTFELIWLPIGTKFTVYEDSGIESILTSDDLNYTA